MNSSIGIGKLYELIDLYKYGSIEGEKTELVIAPLFKDGKYDDSKRVITIGLQGGLSRDRDTFIVDARDFDTAVMPYLINYYEGDEKLNLEVISRSTMDNVTSKSIYETETGDLLYLETLNNSLFDMVNSRRETVVERVVKPPKSQEEKDWEEMLQYARKRRTTANFYKEKFNENERTLLNEMISQLSNETKVNISNSTRAKENNQKVIEDFLKTSSFSEEFKNRIDNNIWKLADVLGAEKRIKQKVNLDDENVREKLSFVVDSLGETDYFDTRYRRGFDSLPEEKQTKGRNKQSEILRLKENILKENISEEEKNKKIKYCDDLLEFLDIKAKKTSIGTEINTVMEAEFEPYQEVILDNYNEFEDALSLVLGGKLNEEHYELIVEKNGDSRNVRLSLINGISRGDSFEFSFANGIEFDNKFRSILESLMNNKESGKTILLNNDMDLEALIEAGLHNQILLKGYENDYYLPKEEIVRKRKVKNIRKEINTTCFEKLHQYVNNYKIRNNDKNILEIFERESLNPYTPASEREKLDIEFATYWNVMAGIFESAYDTMLGEKYAFNNLNEYLFNIMNDYFASVTLNDEKVDLRKLKRLFAESKVPHALVIFNRLFKNQYYLDYVIKYYSSVVEEKEYEYEEEITSEYEDENIDSLGFKSEDLMMFESNILDVAKEQIADITKAQAKENTLSDDIDLVRGAEAEASLIDFKGSLLGLEREIIEEAERQIEASKGQQELIRGAEAEASLIDFKGSLLGLEREIIEEAERQIMASKEQQDLISGAEAEAKIIDFKARLQALEEEILSEAKFQMDLLHGAELQAEDIQYNNERLELIKQIRDSLNEVLAKKIEEDLKRDAVKQAELLQEQNDIIDSAERFALYLHEHQAESELMDAITTVNEYSTREKPASIKVYFRTPEIAEVIVSSGHVGDEEVVFQKDYTKEELKQLSTLLIGIYKNNNDINYSKAFQVPNTDVEGLIVLGTNENVFQISNAPSEIVLDFKNKLLVKENEEKAKGLVKGDK